QTPSGRRAIRMVAAGTYRKIGGEFVPALETAETPTPKPVLSVVAARGHASSAVLTMLYTLLRAYAVLRFSPLGGCALKCCPVWINRPKARALGRRGDRSAA